MAVQRIGVLTGGGDVPGIDELAGQPLAIAGVPASIDNDLGLTGLAIGVDTAMNTIVVACDEIADTATAHDGYLAMTLAIAVGADLALSPEAGRGRPPPGLVDAGRGARSGHRDRSRVDPSCWRVDLGAVLAETDRLLQGQSPLARWRAGAFADIEDALLR